MKAGAAGRDPDRYRLAWHRAECWGYEVDLPLWRELAGRSPRRILDLGCGAGRVTTDLARRGHQVIGLDSDPVLIAALAEAAPQVEIARADARDFNLSRHFELILAPMQLLQLFTEPAEREACLACVRRHLDPDGIFAAAFVELEAEQSGVNLLGDWPPVADFDDLEPGLLAASTTTGLYLEPPGRLRIRRQRQVYLGADASATERHEVDIELALLSRARIEAELAGAGMRLLEWRSVTATERHMGSVVAIAGAACQSD